MSEIHKINVSKQFNGVLNTCRFCGRTPIVYRFMQNQRLLKVVIKCREHWFPEGNILEFDRFNTVEMMVTWNKFQYPEDRVSWLTVDDVDRAIHESSSGELRMLF